LEKKKKKKKLLHSLESSSRKVFDGQDFTHFEPYKYDVLHDKHSSELPPEQVKQDVEQAIFYFKF